ncbi:MAG: cytochrome [Planctomycetaceae bacterium]|nr:cytochrome [Planctomycetaceae bacterium]
MPTASSDDFDTDLLTPLYLANPYPSYAALRDTAPVFFSQRLNAWVLTRYQDVYRALKDGRLVSSRRVSSYSQQLSAELRSQLQPLFDQFDTWIGNMDPPDHTRLRRLVNAAFTTRMVQAMRVEIEQLIEELLAGITSGQTVDFVRDFAYPLPAIVIGRMLGVPREARQQLIGWSNALTAYSGTGQAESQVAQTASQAATSLSSLFDELARQRRLAPRNDLLSQLVQVEDQGNRLSRQELLGMCGFLMVAGHETTMALLANGLLALLRHPMQLQQLRENPAAIPTAVEELLRYDSPIQHQTRSAAETLEIGGQRIRAGDRVMPFLGAANRDPDQFARPDHLDLSRAPNPHLAFGLGPHYCLGAPLARLETELALQALLARWKKIELVDTEPQFRQHTSQRNPLRLQVRFSQ